ncbi:dihydrolipoyl dehydrogenase [Alkalihalobacillus sp. LMS39]|uniref:dihydrolipoyl dehydrogenase n=1 Tax=Alkalihalobacillus sp. LMS39 TaxID=2924032 RepID=UPI001FB2A9D9|nr:dihydrolipoyl dehydrogenase [Alkalihalobacillus sp. LMS39]UOE94903.1 dihydrolipoyl dehydrogenase [Alkalihalobacillus sp. LMS39]
MVVGEVAVETDVVVIGGGPGGYAAAIRLGQLGKSVVLIEKDALGGVCLNRGCIPSKALIHTANEFHKLPTLRNMGIAIGDTKATIDLGQWQGWKQQIVHQLSSGVAHLCEKNGVTVVKGEATFLSDNRIGVETGGDFETYKFEKAIIATGSRPLIPSFLQVDGSYILDSTAALELTEVPSTLTIVGGGYIGIEMGMAFAKLGTDVTIVEMGEQILPQLASHQAKEVARQAKKIGMTIKTSTKVEKAEIENGKVQIEVTSEKKGTEHIESEKVLVTIGRRPNTENIGLDQAGVSIDERGLIHVDEQCRTNVPHIFAIGDITPGVALAHRASKQGIVAAEVIGGIASAVDSPYIPYVIFSDPQVAGVGLTEAEAKQQGHTVKTGRFPFKANGRALATNETDGFAEVIVDADTHLLLGMHVVSSDASNLIGEGVLALELAARVEDVAMSIHPHPTLTEGWLEAAEAALGHAIHILNK